MTTLHEGRESVVALAHGYKYGEKRVQRRTPDWPLGPRNTAVFLAVMGMPVDVVVLLGGWKQGGQKFAYLGKNTLIEMGFKGEIIADPSAKTTEDEVKVFRDLQTRYGWENVMSVATYGHSRRVRQEYRFQEEIKPNIIVAEHVLSTQPQPVNLMAAAGIVDHLGSRLNTLVFDGKESLLYVAPRRVKRALAGNRLVEFVQGVLDG